MLKYNIKINIISNFLLDLWHLRRSIKYSPFVINKIKEENNKPKARVVSQMREEEKKRQISNVPGKYLDDDKVSPWFSNFVPK